MDTRLACGFLITSLTLASGAAVAWSGLGTFNKITTAPSPKPISVEVADVDCGDLLVGPGMLHSGFVTVRNQGERSVRLVGASLGCAGRICHEIRLTPLMELPAGEEVRIPCRIGVRMEGVFAEPFQVWIDVGNLHVVTAMFRGRGVLQ